MSDFLRTHGKRLLDLGYPIIPIKRGYKYPRGIDRWQSIEADQTQLNGWLSNGFSDGGVGIICGDVTGVDLDIRNETITDQMVSFIEKHIGTTIQRIGFAPKTLLVYTTDTPFSKIMSATYVDEHTIEHKVEILGVGQQFVAYAEHPDTKKPYHWVDDCGLADTPFFDLATLSQEQAHEIIEYFESIIPPSWTIKGKKSTSNQLTDYSIPEEIRVLNNLKPPLEGYDATKVKRALSYLIDQTDDYHDWVKVGMALHHQFNGDTDGFAIWDEWSMNSTKYDPKQMQSKWNSFTANLANTNPITFATIVKAAKAVYDSEKRAKQIAEGGLAFLGIGDLFNALKPIEWTIDGYLEANTVGFVYGDPQSYKTFTTLGWALSIATGRDWYGRKVKQSPVIYLSGEGHNGFARRVKAWADHNGGLPDDTPFRLAQGSVPLFDEKAAIALTKLIDVEAKSLGGNPGLIIIDTLARNFGPGDENSAGDASKFIDHVERFLRARYGATVVIVHHTGHSNKSRGRGSSALTGAADFEYILNRTENTARTCLTGLKMKDAAVPEQMWFEAKEITFDIPGEGTATSLALEISEMPDATEGNGLKGKQKALFEIIEKEGPAERETIYEIAMLDNIFDKRSSFRATLGRLREKGMITEHEDRVSVVDEFAGIDEK